jgi:hypothetical protein
MKLAHRHDAAGERKTAIELADVDPIRRRVAGRLLIQHGESDIELCALWLGMTQQRAHHALGAAARERVNQRRVRVCA